MKGHWALLATLVAAKPLPLPLEAKMRDAVCAALQHKGAVPLPSATKLLNNPSSGGT